MKTVTRDKIVTAARELFWQQGYATTGIAEILKRADVGSGSLYYFFPTKEDLLLAVLDWYLGNLDAMVLQPVMSRVSDPVERIFGILDGYRRQLLATDFHSGCPVGNLALEMSNSHPAVRTKIAENFTQWRDAVMRCLGDVAQKLPAGTDTAALASFVLTTMEGAVMQARAYRSIEPFETAVQCLRDYFERLTADGVAWAVPRTSS